MPYHFVCPHCSSETLVDDTHSGQSGPCYSCGEPIALPDFFADLPVKRPSAANLRNNSRIGQVILIVAAGVVALTISVAALMMFAFPGAQTIQGVHRLSVCDRNLDRIGKALLAYHDDHGQFPPAYVADDDGKPMHSCGVLILPYLNENSVFKQYDMNQPWDSEHNARLTSQMPDVYACPSDPEAKRVGESNYMVLVGRNTMFPGASARGFSDLQDELATTILVTETRVSGVTWLEPKDLSEGRLQFAINTGFEREISSYHRSGVNALMADGEVRFVSELTPEEYVRGMSTINKQEEIPLDALDE